MNAKDTATVAFWKDKIVAGATIDDLVRYLVDDNRRPLNAIEIIRQVNGLSLTDAVSIYGTHPSAVKQAAIRRCREKLATGARREEIQEDLPLCGFSDTDIRQAFLACSLKYERRAPLSQDLEETTMSERRQPQFDSQSTTTKDRLIAVRVGPDEVRHFKSEEDLDAAISQDMIQRGLNLAGTWSDLGISEDEMLQTLNSIRGESEPTQPMTIE